MGKSVFVLAVIGAACSSVAFAAEVKKDKAHIPVVKATTMSDSERHYCWDCEFHHRGGRYFLVGFGRVWCGKISIFGCE